MQPVQMKMARAALDLSVDNLAHEAGVTPQAITALETGGIVEGDAVSALNLYLSTHGIQLIDGDGIRAQGSASRKSVPVDELTTGNDGGVS